MAALQAIVSLSRLANASNIAPRYLTPATPAISLPKLKPSRRTVRRTVTTLLIFDTVYSDLSSSFQARATKDTFLVPPDGIGGKFVHCSSDGTGDRGCGTPGSATEDDCTWPANFTVSGGTKDRNTESYQVNTIQEHGVTKIDGITSPSATPT